MDAFIAYKHIGGLKAYRKPIVAAITIALLIGIFVGNLQHVYAATTNEPAKISATSSTETEELSKRINQLVKELEYPDKVAEDFVTMVMGWKDTQGEPVLVAWKKSLNQARQDYKEAKISKAQLAKVEENIVKELSQRIRKEISFDFSEKFFDLVDVIKHKQAQCLGYSQLVYIVGNSVGLSVQAIEVVELMTGLLPPEAGHIASIVSLTDGRTMMVDLVASGFISKPFIIEEEFAKIGNYWELKDKTNPLGIHRRIQILDRNGLIADIYSNRGNVYSDLGQLTQAISDYTKAIELNPKLAEAYSNRGTAYDKLGEYTQAISDYNKAIELNPKLAEAYYNRGTAYDKLGQHTQAISDCTKAIELNPKLAQAYSNRGAAYADLGQHTQAISDYTKAIELNPKFAEAYSNRGVAYCRLGEPEEAKKDLLKAVELNPTLKPHVKRISDHFKLNLKLD
jgi:tetratricopeptide (TPR) repeat protein